MARIDRLTALLENFRLKVRAAALDEANLVVRSARDDTMTLLFSPDGPVSPDAQGTTLVTLHVDTGRGSPLQRGLPPLTVIEVQPGDDLHAMVTLLAVEQTAQRCGGPIVLGRLGEVLMVRILRHQIDQGAITTGLLAGLAHDRLSQAIVAIHNDPGQRWSITDLAEVAGLSESRFKEVFTQLVGETPGTYLRHWRMNLARADIENGGRIDQVAHRYGYSAPDAFSRAFVREFGMRPKKLAKAGFV